MIAAMVVEALIEYGKSVGRAFAAGEYKTAITQLAAVLLSVGLCFAFGADIFSALGIALRAPSLGVLITGIFASRGSNYLSDIVSRIQTAAGTKDAA